MAPEVGTRPGEVAVELRAVRKVFGRPPEGTLALEHVDLVVRAGERVAIVGQTGAGKSTILNLVLGLIAPSAGEVEVLGIDPFTGFAALAGRTAVVFQQDRLLPWRTAVDNAAFGLAMLGVGREERRERATVWLRRLGLEGFERSRPHELSGGMRQRVAIARAMTVEPALLVADEAFSALDELTAVDVREDLIGVLGETGTTTLFVTHSVEEAVLTSDRVIVLRRPGRVAGEVDVRRAGGPDPAAAHVRELLAEARSDGGASRTGHER